MKEYWITFARIAVSAFLAFCSASVGYAQVAGMDPGDYASVLAQHLHDAHFFGGYCTKPLTVKEARFLTRYYGAHRHDPPGKDSIILSDTELAAAKSMANGNCDEPTVAPTVSAGSTSTRPPTPPKDSQAPTPASPRSSAEQTPVSAVQTKGEKAHVIRIGVASPDAQIGQGGAMSSVAEPIRTMMIQYLNGPGLDIVSMNAMLPTQIEAEAKEKACDYVLYSSVTQKKSGGMSFLKAANMASSLTPIGAMAGATRAATAAAGATAAAQAATVSSAVKAKTEYT